jgi:hypothetical protein
VGGAIARVFAEHAVQGIDQVGRRGLLGLGRESNKDEAEEQNGYA